jgi:hypothetical protein
MKIKARIIDLLAACSCSVPAMDAAKYGTCQAYMVSCELRVEACRLRLLVRTRLFFTNLNRESQLSIGFNI